MSKNPSGLDRRLVARLACDGEPSVLLAEITGLPRLEVEAALQVDGELAELRRFYERQRAEPPEARAGRLRRLFVAAVERALEQGDVRGIGWAVRGLGLLEPLAGAVPSTVRAAAAPPSGRERSAIDEVLDELDPEARAEWDEFGYERWPVPPTIPWRPDAPRPQGPLEIENEAGTEAERSRAPLPWPPPHRRGPVRPPAEPGAPYEPEAGGEAGAADPGAGRWPPHLRPV